MDFFWLNKWQHLAWISGGISAMFALNAILFFKNHSKVEILILYASFFWVMMNFSWVLGDDLGLEWILAVARIYFVICLFFTIFAIYISKKENKNFDFKRFKIK